MTKPDDQVPTLSPNYTEPTPPRGWLHDVRLSIKTDRVAPTRSKEPHNALAHAWQTCLTRYYPLQYHKPLGFREGCMLADFGRNIGNQGQAVIEYAIANWKDFVIAARLRKGLFGPQPDEPHIAFFVKYHDCAVNLLLQSIARKKEEEEREAKRQAQQVNAKAIASSTPKTALPQNLAHRAATREECLAIERALNEACAVWDEQVAKGEITREEYMQKLREWANS